MAQNDNPSLLEPSQIIRRAFDETQDRIRVDAEITANISGEQEIIISHVDDSIKIGDGSKIVNTTQVGPDVGLNVNLIGGVVSGNFQSSGLSNGLRTEKIIVNDAPIKIPNIPLNNRNSICIRIWGANIVYFGDSTVTVDNGYPKRQFEEIIIDIKDNSEVELYAVCNSGQSCELRVLELA